MQKYDLSFIKNQLLAIGLKKGDLISLGVSFKKLRRINGGPKKIIDCILEIIGSSGSLIAPAYTKAYPIWAVYAGLTPVFDVKNTKSNTGGLSEILMNEYHAIRSTHPTNSMVGIGQFAKKILSEHTSASAAYSPYSKLAANNGFLLNIGIGDSLVGLRHEAQSICGLLRIYQFRRGVKYRAQNEDIKIFWRHDIGGCVKKMNIITHEMKKLNLINNGVVADADAIMVNARVALNFLVNKLSNEIELYLCEELNCLFCRKVDKYLNSINAPTSPAHSKIGLMRIFLNKIKHIFMCYIHFDK